jgi:hypothetical protein
VNNDIAVIGMAARLPDARTVMDYWRNLASGLESVRTFTDEQLLAAGVPPRKLKDPRYVKAGVVLDGLDQFDAEFFGFSPKEARSWIRSTGSSSNAPGKRSRTRRMRRRRSPARSACSPAAAWAATSPSTC